MNVDTNAPLCMHLHPIKKVADTDPKLAYPYNSRGRGRAHTIKL
jgi:hypothetical protein